MTSVATADPTPYQAMRAADEKVTPMAWANRFGGPGTGRGGAILGAITRVASWPRGLSVGPVRTRAQNP